MSRAETAAEVFKLPQKDRRELVRLIFELEDDADLLGECDRRANEHLLLLDALETEDGKNGPK